MFSFIREMIPSNYHTILIKFYIVRDRKVVLLVNHDIEVFQKADMAKFRLVIV